MQIRNAVVCDTGIAYISKLPPLVVEHAFPLTGFVGLLIMIDYDVADYDDDDLFL